MKNALKALVAALFLAAAILYTIDYRSYIVAEQAALDSIQVDSTILDTNKNYNNVDTSDLRNEGDSLEL